MGVKAEVPITEDDVSVIDERKVVEVSAEKFKELLDYVTHIEDALSMAEFDLSGERIFNQLLLVTFADCINEISSDEGYNLSDFTRRLCGQWTRRLEREVANGLLSEWQFERFNETINQLFPASAVVGETKPT